MVHQLPAGDDHSFEFDGAPVFVEGAQPIVAKTVPVLRSWFIVKLYLHVLFGVLVLNALQLVWFGVTNIGALLLQVLAFGPVSWAVLLLVMSMLSAGARKIAPRWVSVRRQYVYFFLFLTLQSLLLSPMIAYAIVFVGKGDGTLLPRGIVINLVLFACLTLLAIVRRNKFVRMRLLGELVGLAALATVAFSFSYGFTSELLFSYVVLLLACGSIVHLTFPALHKHRTDQHVAVALGLIASALPPLWWLVPPTWQRLRDEYKELRAQPEPEAEKAAQAPRKKT